MHFSEVIYLPLRASNEATKQPHQHWPRIPLALIPHPSVAISRHQGEGRNGASIRDPSAPSCSPSLCLCSAWGLPESGALRLSVNKWPLLQALFHFLSAIKTCTQTPHFSKDFKEVYYFIQVAQYPIVPKLVYSFTCLYFGTIGVKVILFKVQTTNIFLCKNHYFLKMLVSSPIAQKIKCSTWSKPTLCFQNKGKFR